MSVERDQLSSLVGELPGSDASQAPELATLPLFVAVKQACNMRCGYCTIYGEGRSAEPGQLSTGELVDVLGNAYESGVRTFRFTGGEPTLDLELGDKMLAAQALGDDVRVALTTNGARLRPLFPTLEQLKDPRVFVSVDSYDNITQETTEQGLRIEKWLKPRIQNMITDMPDNVHTRINFVLTAANQSQLPKLVDYAVEQGIDIKVFELLLRDYAFVEGQDPEDVFARQFVSVRTVLPSLAEQYGQADTYSGTGGKGIPMSSFKVGDSRVIFFDSGVGSHYGEPCAGCPAFPCQEGLYAMTINENGVVHPSGCVNESTYVGMAAIEGAERTDAFRDMASMIGQATFRPDVPEAVTALLDNPNPGPNSL
ncbi:MAG TPA: radical SAM protein [Candidatus Saccharimonadales bacterium]